MNILCITTNVPYPPTDGGRIATFEAIKHLALRGHKITVVAPINSHTEIEDVTELTKYCTLETVAMDTQNTYRGMLCNLFSPKPYTISKYHCNELLTKIKTIVGRKQFDIVNIDHLHMAYYGAIIKERFGLPIVLREQNVESTIMKRYCQALSNPIKKFYLWLQFKKLYSYESTIVEFFDRCFMITEVDKQRIENMNPKVKATVIPAGVDTSYFHPFNVQIEPYSIISVGSMAWLPNVEGTRWFCSKVLPRIKKKLPESRVYIVGKNPPSSIHRLASENIVITGFVKDVREYMAKAAVFIVPLKTGGGMRIKILNALAMGKAIVSTSVGCEGIDVENGKDILIADSEEDFANRTIELLEDSRKRTALGQEGLRLVRKKYQWEQIAEQMENEYLLVLKTTVN